MRYLIRCLAKKSFQYLFDGSNVSIVIKPTPASIRGWGQDPHTKLTIDNLITVRM